MMVLSVRLTLLAVILTCCCLESSARVSCSSRDINCKDGSQCVALSYVCRGGSQCTDGSDEDPQLCKFWKYSADSCGNRGQFLHNGNCYYIRDMCTNQLRSASINPRICKIVEEGELKVPLEGMKLTEEVVSQLGAAVNSTLDATPGCPMFYIRVGNVCLSFFSLAKVPWAEARHFCQSISGDLLNIKDNTAYVQLLQYMKETSLTSDYWVGGRYDLDTNSWAWTTDDSPMPLGSPFWALKFSSTCSPRPPPHSDPFRDPASPLPGAPCYHYLQGPQERAAGWCAALTYEHYYYVSDEDCQDSFSPLCVLTATNPIAPSNPHR